MRRKRNATITADYGRPITRRLAQLHTLEQQRRQSARSLLGLPLELREMIYSFVLSTNHTRSPPQPLLPVLPADAIDHSGAIHQFFETMNNMNAVLERHEQIPHHTRAHSRQSRVLDAHASELLRDARREVASRGIRFFSGRLAILATNKQLSGEVLSYLHRKCVVGLRIYSLSSQPLHERYQNVLLNAQRIHILHGLYRQRKNYPVLWTASLRSALETRDNIVSFEYDGHGHTVFRSVDRLAARMDPGAARWIDVHADDEIMRTMEQLPRVKASRFIRFRWQGDDEFGDDEINERIRRYQDLKRQFESGSPEVARRSMRKGA